ncbi:MAG TPA: hypothetical protein VFC19_48380 [Candidatus Limnocylindrales bacterium]|nr:hypothetical protein [Candidatus Limnocylindrales bacterium]
MAIDAASGRELWRAPAMWTRGDIFATTAAIRVPASDGYAVYDLTGKRLVTIDGMAHWVDDEHLLAWEKGDTVSAYSVFTGERIVLGRAAWNICSWTRTMLACPTERGISVWRYRTNE